MLFVKLDKANCILKSFFGQLFSFFYFLFSFLDGCCQ